MKVEVITFQDWRKLHLNSDDIIVTVSKSTNWSAGLSPFNLGPCKLYGNYISKTVENAWQFSKVYKQHIQNNEISKEYYEWAINGWNDSYSHRYPMGKGAIPEFSLWGDKRLDYVQARKTIYIPLYYNAVKDTAAFKTLKTIYDQHKDDDKNLYLIDFDAYRHNDLNMTYKDVINCKTKKMGHAFILAMMLEIPSQIEQAVNNVIVH